MRPRLLTVAAATCLLLSLAACTLWIRSWHGGDGLERVEPSHRIVVTSLWGMIELRRWDGPFEPQRRADFDPGRAPRQAWRKWSYQRGASGLFGGLQPLDYPYQPALSGDHHWWQFFGFDAYDYRHKPHYNSIPLHDWVWPTWSGRERAVTVPHWSVVLTFLVLPAFAATRALLRARPSRAGLCPTCGYDLRASPDRCPECGTPGSRHRRPVSAPPGSPREAGAIR